MLDRMSVDGHSVRMRTRKPISREALLAALVAAEHDVDEAAKSFEVSGRTLRRRMAEYGIKPRVRYEAAEAA